MGRRGRGGGFSSKARLDELGKSNRRGRDRGREGGESSELCGMAGVWEL